MATEAPANLPADDKAGDAPPPASNDAAPAGGAGSAQTPRSASSRRRSLPQFYKPEEKEKAALKIDQGKGSKLKDIPNARFRLAKLRPDDELLTAMHTLFYRRQGTGNKRKKAVLEFSGIPYADEDAKKAEMAKAEDKLGKWHLGLLSRLLDCFDLPKGSGESGQKASKIERAVEFLMKPKISTGKSKAEMELKRKEKTKKKPEDVKKKTEKEVKPKVQKRKPGEEPRRRGRPPKKPKVAQAENAKETADKGGKEPESNAPKPVEGNGLSEAVVKEEVLKTLKASDIENLSMPQVFASLTESLGQDVSLWKAMIKELAVQYTKEHMKAEMEGKCEKADEPMEDAKEEKEEEVGKEDNVEKEEKEVEVAKEEKAAKEEKEAEEMKAKDEAKVEKVAEAMDVDAAPPQEGSQVVFEGQKGGQTEERREAVVCEPEKANGHA